MSDKRSIRYLKNMERIEAKDDRKQFDACNADLGARNGILFYIRSISSIHNKYKRY